MRPAPVAPRSMGAILTAVARLTPAQHALLGRLSAHSGPVTVTRLAEESNLHVSSVRETLEGLSGLGLVSREQLPATGRGRPSIGYTTQTPSDPGFAARMLEEMVGSTLEWLRACVDDPAGAARAIGRNWGVRALRDAEVPDHSAHPVPPEGFSLPRHMAKIRLFLTHLGFVASPHPTVVTGLVLEACPWTDEESPDPLALEIRRGIVESVLEATAAGHARVEFVEDAERPMRVEVLLHPTRSQSDREKGAPVAGGDAGLVTVSWYGGAAEAAGCERESVAPAATLGELVKVLASRSPELAAVLAVSSFLVDGRPAQRGDALRPGCALDVLPPFAGG